MPPMPEGLDPEDVIRVAVPLRRPDGKAQLQLFGSGRF